MGRHLAASAKLATYSEQLMTHPEYSLDAVRRKLVLVAIQEACAHRGWLLHAAHVRSNHVHVVVEADRDPGELMVALKAYASRTLNECGLDEGRPKRWARHGSTRWLWTGRELDRVVRYVVDEQGEAMEVYERKKWQEPPP